MGLEKFTAALDLLKGYYVNLFVGEEVYKGKLLGVEEDHVVLETDQKFIFYYRIDKIQAITKNTKDFKVLNSKTPFQKTQSLIALLNSFQHTWVTILSIHKQRFSGVLSEVDSDFVTLINGEERILLKLEYVSNILKGFIKEETKAKEKKEEAEGQNKTENKQEQSKEKAAAKKDNSNQKTEKNAEAAKSDSHSEKNVKAEIKENDDKHQAAAQEHTGWSKPFKLETPVASIEEEESHSSSGNEESTQEEKTAPVLLKAVVKKNSDNQNDNKTKNQEKTKQVVSQKGTAKEKNEQKSKQVAKSDTTAAKTKEKTRSDAVSPNKKEMKTTGTAPAKSKDKIAAETAQSPTANTKFEKGQKEKRFIWNAFEQEKKSSRFAGEGAGGSNVNPSPFEGESVAGSMVKSLPFAEMSSGSSKNSYSFAEPAKIKRFRVY